MNKTVNIYIYVYKRNFIYTFIYRLIYINIYVLMWYLVCEPCHGHLKHKQNTENTSLFSLNAS